MNYDAIAVWSQIVAFVLFVAAIMWVWQKSIAPAVANAQRASNERIALAERHRDEMRQAVESLEGGIAGAARDAESIKSRVATQAVHEREAIVAEARSVGERAIKNAQGELARSRAAARVSLRDRLADRALQIARGEAQRRVDDAGNTALVNGFLSSLERTERGNGTVTDNGR
ncbi:MAG: hypothetical protein M3R51_02840 [Candidatus Eremiobacteraeota bacterium]|nr:hypothetical protein [Candidatus Eremiobacteraeota bacterium]